MLGKLVVHFSSAPAQCEAAAVLAAVDWVIVPLLNPDGYEWSHTRDRWLYTGWLHLVSN